MGQVCNVDHCVQGFTWKSQHLFFAGKFGAVELQMSLELLLAKL